MTFYYRIFVVFVFDEISKGMLVTIEKELGEYFQRLIFEISGFLHGKGQSANHYTQVLFLKLSCSWSRNTYLYKAFQGV